MTFNPAADLLRENGFEEEANKFGMIPELVEAFDQNRNRLLGLFQDNEPQSYLGLLATVIAEIVGDNLAWEKITEVNDGDYQGTLLFLIPVREYQPNRYYYTKVGYGSCSGCDTLQGIQYDTPDERPKQFLTLALHMIQNMRTL